MERKWLDALRAMLPQADLMEQSEETLLKIVRHALHVRAKTPWGRCIPEWIFQAFVLFPRVNNEHLTFYQSEIYRELAPRIAGMSMAQAVLEVNRWACECAAYQSTDDRTADALTVMRLCAGRCGEESTLLVSALRCVGIPARQVYVPRWSHCDDNHAWVEAWVDGDWHYLGACEPEPVLDSGWFTAAASKAMLVHTRAYGVLPQGERVECKIGNAYIINRTAAYAKTRLLTVRVTENGRPRAGLCVRFEIANMAELYPIAEHITDARGEASLLTGMGTIQLHVHDAKRYLRAQIDVRAQAEINLRFEDAAEFERDSSFRQCAPQETEMQPSVFSEDVLSAHRAMLVACHAKRAQRIESFPKSNAYLEKARGNGAQIKAFWEDARFSEADKRALLDTLTDKDFGDISQETLTDALEGALPFQTKFPEAIWRRYLLCPRVENEPLSSARSALRGANIDSVKVCAMEPEGLIPELRAILAAGKCSQRAWNVLYVAICRANGIPARLNAASAAPEIWQDGWRSLREEMHANACLSLVERSGKTLVYGVDFTVGVLENGAYRTLEKFDQALHHRLDLPVCAGKYRIIACRRQIDESYDGAIVTVELKRAERAEVEIVLPPDRTSELMQSAPLSPIFVGGRVLPQVGSASILAAIAPGQEPTEHFLNEILAAKEAIAQRGLSIVLMVESAQEAGNPKLHQVLAQVPKAQLLTDVKPNALLDWREAMRAGDLRLPLAIAVDQRGLGKLAITNYRVGSVMTLIAAGCADV